MKLENAKVRIRVSEAISFHSQRISLLEIATNTSIRGLKTNMGRKNPFKHFLNRLNIR